MQQDPDGEAGGIHCENPPNTVRTSVLGLLQSWWWLLRAGFSLEKHAFVFDYDASQAT